MKANVGERPRVRTICPMCGGSNLVVHFTYSEPPPLETRFPLAKGESYWRELHRCRQCGHYRESFAPDQSRLYAGEYVSTLYQDRDGIKLAFDKIKALPAEKSDNVGRVRFVDTYCRSRWSGDKSARGACSMSAQGLACFHLA